MNDDELTPAEEQSSLQASAIARADAGAPIGEAEPEEKKALTVVSLTVSNVLAVKALAITPTSRMVKLGGRGHQGKSSTLNAIEIAMRGRDAMPPETLRHGTRKGSIILDLGEIVVERRFTSGGDPTLVVKNAEGVAQKRPQELLNKLCSKIAFDAGEFSRMEVDKQDEILKKLAGIDFTKLDAERLLQFTARTDDKRTLKAGEAVFNAMVEYPGVPKEETSAVEAARELAAARETNHAHERSVGIEERLQESVARAQRDVVKLEAQLAEARADLAAQAELLSIAVTATAQLGAVIDTTALEVKLGAVEQTNAKVRSNQQRALKGLALSELETVIEARTAAIEAIDAKKQAILATAKFPVPGLGFDDLGPTLNGIPFQQASDSEKIRVSAVIGFKMNPRLKVVLIRQGSLCDKEATDIIAEVAEAEGGQVWLEMVSEDGAGCEFVIEDGGLKEPAATAAE